MQVKNHIAHYINADTGALLFSEPFYENRYAEEDAKKILLPYNGQRYKTYDEFLAEIIKANF